MKLKNLWASMLLMGIATYSLEIRAENCYPIGTPMVYNYDFKIDSSDNKVGYETNWNTQYRHGRYSLEGGCRLTPYKKATFFTFKPGPGMTHVGNKNGAEWFDLPENEYLQVASSIYISGEVRQPINVPVVAFSNGCGPSTNCGTGGNYETGNTVNVKLRIKKRFVGESFIVNREIAQVFAATEKSDVPDAVIARVLLNLTMIVPQRCRFDVGDVIEFNFKEIPTHAFTDAGAGNKPERVNVISQNLGIECQNIEAQQMMSVRLEATNTKDNIILSNNPDVGFHLADKDNRILWPNNINSKINFKLDDQYKSNFILNAWPISITGLRPKAGSVLAEGHVRVDFD